jgi:hypothetical protein
VHAARIRDDPTVTTYMHLLPTKDGFVDDPILFPFLLPLFGPQHLYIRSSFPR